jgi:Protein of unknown function (DUF2946)
MRGKAQRRVIAAWFGLIALALQVELPLLVAIEISLANRAAANSAFEICGYGPKAERTHGTSHHPARDGDGLCPICIALHTGSVFTAPATVALPLPSARAIAVSTPETRSAPPLVALSAYRSRAPPIG